MRKPVSVSVFHQKTYLDAEVQQRAYNAKKDNNGGFCPFESACPRHCTDGAAKDCGLDTSGCPVWRCGSCDTEATVDEVVVPPEAPAGPPPEAPAEGPAETPAEGPAETPAETPAEEPAPLPPAEAQAE